MFRPAFTKSPRRTVDGPTGPFTKRRAFSRRLACEALEDRRLLAVITVTSALDGVTDDGDITLREAILAANNDTLADAVEGQQAGDGADTIQFDPALSGQTITLTEGHLTMTSTITIEGPGAEQLAVSGNNSSRIFVVGDYEQSIWPDVAITGLTLTGGRASEGGGAIRSAGSLLLSEVSITGNRSDAEGGGVYSNGLLLRIVDSLVSENSGGGVDDALVQLNTGGGGIFVAAGGAAISDTRVSNNESSARGGGIAIASGVAVAIIQRSLIMDNVASEGGGVYTESDATIDASTIGSNTAKIGGGIATRLSAELTVEGTSVIFNTSTHGSSHRGGGGILVEGPVTITNSTISGNVAKFGGGIDLKGHGPNYIAHSTITNNIALGDDVSNAGGILNESFNPRELTLYNTIVAGNQGPVPDLTFRGDELTVRYCLIGDYRGRFLAEARPDEFGNYVGGPTNGAIDPWLGGLANIGGSTPTHIPLALSPAINAGDPDFTGSPEFDQRGPAFARMAGERVDIGAVELQLAPLLVDTIFDDVSDEHMSLRRAIMLANERLGLDVIGFDRSLNGQTISVSEGQLSISDSVTIAGPGADELTIGGNGASRIVAIDDGDPSKAIEVVLTGVTITGGRATGDGGAIRTSEHLTLADVRLEDNRASGNGGAIHVDSESGTVDIRDSRIERNLAEGSGGGAFFAGKSHRIERSEVSNNRSQADGGGVAADLTQQPMAEIQILASTISANVTSGDGGGIDVRGNAELLIEQSTLASNQAAQRGGGVSVAIDAGGCTLSNSSVVSNTAENSGGGVYSAIADRESRVLVINTTVSGNTSGGAGGGAYGARADGGPLEVNHSTIVQNVSTDPDPYSAAGVFFAGPAVLDHTILADNQDAAGNTRNITFTTIEQTTIRFSLVGDNRGSGLAEADPDANGNIIGGPTNGVVDAKLEPLVRKDGLTLWYEPHMDSPALDAGDPNFTAPPDSDQRGAARVFGERIDIGSVEYYLAADFNGDSFLDSQDIDMLVRNISYGVLDLAFDITWDGLVDQADIAKWLEIAGKINLPSRRPYLFGDATLNGPVNSADLGILGLNWRQQGDGWSNADFNSDGWVNAADLNILAGNWQKSALDPIQSASLAVVPAHGSARHRALL